jgi:hypothetical protein
VKKSFRNLAIACLVTAIAGWIAWGVVSAKGPGEHGEFWSEWNRTIDVIWIVIPASFALSLVSAVAWALAPPRSRRGTAWAVALLVVTLCVAAWFAFVLTHLGIQ